MEFIIIILTAKPSILISRYWSVNSLEVYRAERAFCWTWFSCWRSLKLLYIHLLLSSIHDLKFLFDRCFVHWLRVLYEFVHVGGQFVRHKIEKNLFISTSHVSQNLKRALQLTVSETLWRKLQKSSQLHE